MSIKAQIIADSKNIFDDRITTFILRYPRIIHSEFMTHRLFSRNAASSRAIPSERLIKMIEEDPFIPIAFQKEHTGMQGTEYFTHQKDIEILTKNWLLSRDFAIQEAKILLSFGVTKQLVNRLLEPYQWYTVICTATEWENFFALRCPQYSWQEKGNFRSWKDLVKDSFNNGANRDWVDELENTDLLTILQNNKGQAEIHIMALAEAMWDAYRTSTPKELQPGEWHIPFGDVMDEDRIVETLYKLNGEGFLVNSSHITQAKLEIATARCARVSYLNYEGKDDYENDFRLFKQLKDSKHMSPFEHCASSMSQKDYDNNIILEGAVAESGWCRNFKGFIQMRAMIE